MHTLNWFAPILLTAMALASPACAQTLPGGFVYLGDIDPTIIQDIRYAGANNFAGRPLAGYGAAECVVKPSVGLALKGNQQALTPKKLSLKMLDCYRPVRAVHDMAVWARNGQETPAERRYNPAFSKADLIRLGYIAERSGHSTGVAVDLTLVDLTADNSPRFVRAKQAGKDVESVRNVTMKAHPIGRLGAAEDIALAIVFLASDDAGFMTGSAWWSTVG